MYLPCRVVLQLAYWRIKQIQGTFRVYWAIHITADMRKIVICFMFMVQCAIGQCQDDAFDKGSNYLLKGDYKLADSLFTLSIIKNPGANNFINRAIARLYLLDTAGFCDDLHYAFSLFMDKEAKKTFLTTCAKVDTIFYDKNFIPSNDDIRYAELTVNEKYSNSKWGEYVDLKHEKNGLSIISSSGLNINSFKSNVVASYKYEGDEKIFKFAESIPLFPKRDIHDYVKKQIQYTIELNNAIRKSGKTPVIVTTYFVVDSSGIVKNAAIWNRDSITEQILIDESIRIINNLPQFKPARFNKHPIAIQMTLPITFENVLNP